MRDQTLSFIQNISIFIRLLNTENGKIDNELKAIMVSLKRLIETLGNIDFFDKSKKINEQINELENCMSLMINELKSNKIENVIKVALELARTANDLFLVITKSNSIA